MVENFTGILGAKKVAINITKFVLKISEKTI